jgi:hypothetical protein
MMTIMMMMNDQIRGLPESNSAGARTGLDHRNSGVRFFFPASQGH